MKQTLLAVSLILSSAAFAAGTRHAGNPVYLTYDGRVMAGYQGWFHNRSGGVMYPNEESVRIDMWSDVSEYEKTYSTGLKLANGETARFFCSDDESTVETHFRWMEEYGFDGVFLQRFFGNATRRSKEGREASATGDSPRPQGGAEALLKFYQQDPSHEPRNFAILPALEKQEKKQA